MKSGHSGTLPGMDLRFSTHEPAQVATIRGHVALHGHVHGGFRADGRGEHTGRGPCHADGFVLVGGVVSDSIVEPIWLSGEANAGCRLG